MGISLNTNFEYKGPLPLDSRQAFTSIEERDAYPVADLYEGIITHISGKYYEYTRDADNVLAWRDHNANVVEPLTEEEVNEIIDSL